MSDVEMSQVPVKLANTCELWVDTPNGPVYESSQVDNRMIPVVPLSALREVVEGLKNIESHCDRIAVLSKCSGSIKEAQMAQVEAQRLLASLGEQ